MSNPDAARQKENLPWQRLPLQPVGAGLKMLEGVRVLDLTTSVAGPYGTMLLSDFGAEVIKIERPEGDDARHWGPPFLNEQALWFTAINRNKKSVVMDLRDTEQRTMFDCLVATCDVFVTNQPVDVQQKLGLDYAAIRALRPDVIFLSITGFGLTGERSVLTCYDLIAEGYSGIMEVTGEADGPPQKVGAPAADMLAGQDAAMAVLAALHSRRTAGKGCQIEISLVESMTRFLSCRISSYLGSGEVPRRSGGTDSVIAIYQSFDTADEPLTLGVGSNAIWRRLWQTLGDPAYGHLPEFTTNAKRREKREEIVKYIQDILKKKSRAEWLETFAAARVPAGPINRVDDVAHDAGLQDRGLFFVLQDGHRTIPQIGLGIHFDGEYVVPRSGPPLLGQHTEEVLSALPASSA